MRPLTYPHLAARARELRAQKWSYSRIARFLGTYPTTVKRWLDPEYAEYRKAQINAGRRKRNEQQAA